jgi:hypothetical protein
MMEFNNAKWPPLHLTYQGMGYMDILNQLAQ